MQASFFKQVNRRVGVSIILNKTTNTQEENHVQDLLQLRKILSIERTYKFLIKSFVIF
jgi:RNase P/RNase MRP subunit p30